MFSRSAWPRWSRARKHDRRGIQRRYCVEQLEARTLLTVGLVKDLLPGPASSYLSVDSSGVNLNGTYYFTPNDGVHGFELWRSDGTADGTSLVKDINPGVGSGVARLFDFGTDVNGTLFFTANDGVHGFELWKSDGTAEGTTLVKDISPGSGDSFPSDLIDVNGTLFFEAYDDVHGFELWKSDGTAEGTTLVKDILPGSRSTGLFRMTEVNGTLFFAAYDDIHGRELWRSDGTVDGTTLVADINPGSGNSAPSGMTEVNGTLFFAAGDGVHGRELWWSDGTVDGSSLVKDIFPGSGDSSPFLMTEVNGTLFFTAAVDDGVHGRYLWRSDGTADGTSLISNNFGPFPSDLTEVNGTLFFAAYDDVHGRELWRSDGTVDGTTLVADINPGSGSSAPFELISVNGTLFFAADDGTHGRELWQFTDQAVSPFVVTTADDNGNNTAPTPGSLRAAIAAANAAPDLNTITFAIPGDGPHTITLAAPLPSIVHPVTIDGYSQPGSSPNTLAEGSNAVLMIELDGSGAGAGAQGLEIAAGNSTVRGLAIHSFAENAILVHTNGGNVIEGNSLGTNVTGMTALGNHGGVFITGSASNRVGTDGDGVNDLAERNIISGNGGNGGVTIADGGADGNVVAGNLIGTDAAGTGRLGNLGDGVAIVRGASLNRIGTDGNGVADTAERNVIAANQFQGILIAGSGTSGNVVAGNAIGTDAAGALDLGNGGTGVLVSDAAGNRIGGTTAGEGNAITFNDGTGVVILNAAATGNAVLSNAIHDNGGRGIALVGGANHSQAAPVLASAVNDGGGTVVEGTLHGTPNTTFRVEFFASDAADPSGVGEGQRFLQAIDVTTDGNGDASFSVTLPIAVPIGQFLTATATDPGGNTSEFSAARIVEEAAEPLAIAEILVNGGTAQRSNVETISVRFNQAANLQQLIDDGTIVNAVQLFGTAQVPLSTARFRYDAGTFTLTIDLTTDGFGGSRSTLLPDGRYQLRLATALIHAGSASNSLVDDDGVADGVRRYNFHRLLGDFDGDAAVGLNDRALLYPYIGTTQGGPGYDFAFDLNGDGVINAADLLLIRRRLGMSV